MDLQGTEAPVLETQQMMRMVLVMGSEGMSFTLGSLGPLIIIALSTRRPPVPAQKKESPKIASASLRSLVLGPDHSVGPVRVGGRHGDEPQTGVGAENLDEVLVGTDVVDVGAGVGVALALEVVERGGVGEDELDVELEEHGDDDEEGGLDDDADGADDEVDGDGLGGLDEAEDFVDEERVLAGEGEDEGEDDVEEEEHEELAVGEAHAVGDPGTVVVHVEHAPLAGRAVVAPESGLNYRSGLKLWHSRQQRRFRFSLSSAKKPQQMGTRPGSPRIALPMLTSSSTNSRLNTTSSTMYGPGFSEIMYSQTNTKQLNTMKQTTPTKCGLISRPQFIFRNNIQINQKSPTPTRSPPAQNILSTQGAAVGERGAGQGRGGLGKGGCLVAAGFFSNNVGGRYRGVSLAWRWGVIPVGVFQILSYSIFYLQRGLTFRLISSKRLLFLVKEQSKKPRNPSSGTFKVGAAFKFIKFIKKARSWCFEMDVELMITVAKKELSAAFKMFDVDRSGYLEKNEFGQLIRRIAMAFHVEEPTFTDIDNLVSALDVNGDGKITQAEFEELIVQIVEIIKEERQSKEQSQ